jgi:hypothetical protein
LIGWDRSCEQVALAGVATRLAQLVELIGLLDDLAAPSAVQPNVARHTREPPASNARETKNT